MDLPRRFTPHDTGYLSSKKKEKKEEEKRRKRLGRNSWNSV